MLRLSCNRVLLMSDIAAKSKPFRSHRRFLIPSLFTTSDKLDSLLREHRGDFSTSTLRLNRSEKKYANNAVRIGNEEFQTDDYTNITPHVLSHIGRNLHLTEHHPICLLKKRIVNFVYKSYVNRAGNPLFAVCDQLSPIVTTEQNFDSLGVPKDHISRSKKDSYYVNSTHMLRPHTSAHQRDMIRSGLDRFLVVGDVYRRDSIDATHYPVFHQMEGVRIYTRHQLFAKQNDITSLFLFENGEQTPEKQACHTLEAAKLVEYEAKSILEAIVKHVFGQDVKYRWVEAYFPFTHPSFELELFHNNDWMEILGGGVMQQSILEKAGAADKIGWAWGIGLERWAMKLYSIPDIRLFWSRDTGFLNQFNNKDPEEKITYQPISKYPQCYNDISFWIPEGFSSNDFYDVVRRVGEDIVEQVNLIDNFKHPKTGRASHCYRIIYRHMERTLTQEEVNKIHKEIETKARRELQVEIR